MIDVVIFGAGKYAEVVAPYFLSQGLYNVVAFTVDADYIPGDSLLRRSVLPFEGIERKFPPDRYEMFVALGYQKLNELRAEKYRAAKAKGYDLLSYVDPRAAVSGEIGDNCVVLEHAVVQPTARIGSNVTLWWSSCIGHHSVVRDHCYLAGHVSVGGNTVIGPYCFIGLNATIGHGITIGAGSLIGAGTLVTKDVPAGTVVARSDTPHHRLDSKAFSSLGRL